MQRQQKLAHCVVAICVWLALCAFFQYLSFAFYHILRFLSNTGNAVALVVVFFILIF